MDEVTILLLSAKQLRHVGKMIVPEMSNVCGLAVKIWFESAVIKMLL